MQCGPPEDYRIAGKFQGRKLSRIDEHEDFAEKTFADSCCRPDTGCARMRCSRRKLSRTGRYPRNLRKFSPSKVSHYTVSLGGTMLWVHLILVFLTSQLGMYLPTVNVYCCYKCHGYQNPNLLCGICLWLSCAIKPISL